MAKPSKTSVSHKMRFLCEWCVCVCVCVCVFVFVCIKHRTPALVQFSWGELLHSLVECVL